MHAEVFRVVSWVWVNCRDEQTQAVEVILRQHKAEYEV
jgi:hypothetical protein